MTDLVFLEPNKLGSEPFTTSDIIADCAQVKHDTVQHLCRTHRTDLEEFGKLGFEIRPLPSSRTGQSTKLYRLNEQQATLLITYLKNTPPVRQFKKDLVQEFYRMRRELTRRQIFRDAGKPIRRTLTDVIRDSGEDGRMHGHAYGTYTDLAYKAATGKIARILRKERGACAKAIATDFLTSDELSAYNKAEERLTVLLDMGLTYGQIKTLLLVQTSKRLAG